MSDFNTFKSISMKVSLKVSLKNRKNKKKIYASTSIEYLKLNQILKLVDARECFLNACNIGNLNLMSVIYQNESNSINLIESFKMFCMDNQAGILSIQVADWMFQMNKNILNVETSDIIEKSDNDYLKCWLKCATRK